MFRVKKYYVFSFILIFFFVNWFFLIKTCVKDLEETKAIQTIHQSFSSFITSEDDGRVGNVLCAYSSLMFFKFKYGFRPVLASWQLDKLNLIFKREEMKISVNSSKMPSYAYWEGVGNENHSSGRTWGVFEPNDEFMKNIDNYKENRYLNDYIQIFCGYTKNSCLI